MSSPCECAVLVPCYGTIDFETQEALYALSRKGYEIRRLRGLPVDAARNVLASEAIHDGFKELLWIDADIVFRLQDVERHRSHDTPIVCGLYPKKDAKHFACEFLEGTEQVSFGKDGDLVELRFAGMGFMRTRSEVFAEIERGESLPRCQLKKSAELVPYFLPMILDDGASRQYLSEDYAFCERARRSGFKIVADTSIRLFHVGRHRYTWEDVAQSKPRR
jgi:hypothetical protein